MAVRGLVGLILDNTIPGTLEERGLLVWQQPSGEGVSEFTTASIDVYDLPFGLNRLYKYRLAKYLPFVPFKDEEDQPVEDAYL